MTADCADLTSAARAYIMANNVHICGYNSAISSLAVQPLNTVPGDCGTSTILLNKIGGGSTLSVNYGFYSSLQRGGARPRRDRGLQ